MVYCKKCHGKRSFIKISYDPVVYECSDCDYKLYRRNKRNKKFEVITKTFIEIPVGMKKVNPWL